MKKHLKLFIFTVLACTFLLSAGVSAEAASKIRINDENFSQQMKYYAEREDNNQDGYLSEKEASKITEIHFESNENTDIFRGIRYFTNLKELWFESYIDRRNPEDITEAEKSNIQKMDLSGLKKLQKLEIECGNSYLQQINLEGCTNLKEIYIQGDENISDINLDQCVNLQKLYCSQITMDKIKLSGMKKLQEAQLGGVMAKSVVIKKCPALKRLDVSGHNMTKLKLKDIDNVEDMYLWSKSLPSLDVSSLSGLKKLTCQLSACSFLDLSENKNLKNFNCSYSEGLREVNVSGCKKLKVIRCNHSGLKKLNVKKITNLQVLLCKQTNIKKLNLKNNRNLKQLECNNTNIKELNLSNTRIRESSALKCDPDVTVTYAK